MGSPASMAALIASARMACSGRYSEVTFPVFPARPVLPTCMAKAAHWMWTFLQVDAYISAAGRHSLTSTLQTCTGQLGAAFLSILSQKAADKPLMSYEDAMADVWEGMLSTPKITLWA